MKTSNKVIRIAIKTIIVFAGIVAFFVIAGEPTEEWYAWTNRNFGSLAWAWFLFEKAVAGGFICALVKLYEKIDPDAFKDIRNCSPETSEE